VCSNELQQLSSSEFGDEHELAAALEYLDLDAAFVEQLVQLACHRLQPVLLLGFGLELGIDVHDHG